jgi:hypothetical protein
MSAATRSDAIASARIAAGGEEPRREEVDDDPHEGYREDERAFDGGR